MLSILDGVLNVLASLAAHAELIGELMDLPPSHRIVVRTELDQISSEMKSHRSTTQSLLGISDDIRLMIHNVLAFRNQEMLVRNGISLAQLAQAGADDSRLLATMTDKTQKDSRTMRIATFIAMLYLPANLVMSFFSTSLVDFYSSEQSSVITSTVNMKIHGQTWIAVVTSLALAVGTVAAVTVWDRHGR